MATDRAATMPIAIREPGEDATIDEIRNYAAAMREQARFFSASLETTTRLLETTLNTSSSNPNRTRRPELPAWDPINLEAWIRRTENAFLRANIKEAKDKFAHLESIISVDLHPTVNSFFNGVANDEQWKKFIAFLRERYGRTKEQKTRTAIDGIKRNGRLPTDLAALLDDMMGDVSIEDIKKAHVLHELPPSVRQSLAERVDSMTYKELAAAADSHFNRDGTLRISTSSSTINAVRSETFVLGRGSERPPIDNPNTPNDNYTASFNDAIPIESDINAISRHRNNNSRGRNNNNIRRNNSNAVPSASQTARQPMNNNNQTSRPTSRPPLNRSTAPNGTYGPQYCRNHQRWGDQTRSCLEGCPLYSTGNGQEARR